MKGAVEECLAETGVLAALAAAQTKTVPQDPDGLDAAEALEFLRANGYPVKKGQLYKETSNGTIPFRKFGNKLHFKAAELLRWAQSRLTDGNAVGILDNAPKTNRKGGAR